MKYRCGTCAFETDDLDDLACGDWRTCAHFAAAKDADTLPSTSAVHRYADRIDAKAIRRRLGREWNRPVPMGEDGWLFTGHTRNIIVTLDFESEPGTDWVHASIAYRDTSLMPAYADLATLHYAVFGNGHSYQVFVPGAQHINIRRNVLHLWGRLDGKPVLPDFGQFGTI